MSLEKYSQTLNSFLELKQPGFSSKVTSYETLALHPVNWLGCGAQLYLEEGKENVALSPPLGGSLEQGPSFSIPEKHYFFESKILVKYQLNV